MAGRGFFLHCVLQEGDVCGSRGEGVLSFVQSFCPALGVTLASHVADERATGDIGASATTPVSPCVLTVARGVLCRGGANMCPRGSPGAAIFEHSHLEIHSISI